MLLFHISRWAMLRSCVCAVYNEESDDVMTWWISWQSSLSRILSEDYSCCVFSRDFPESALQPQGGRLGLWPKRLWHWPKDPVRLMSMTGCSKSAFVWVWKALLWLRCRKVDVSGYVHITFAMNYRNMTVLSNKSNQPSKPALICSGERHLWDNHYLFCLWHRNITNWPLS